MRTIETKTDGGTERLRSDFGNALSVLAGDTRIVRRLFFLMVGRGWFRKLMAHYGPDIELFLEDLCEEVFLALFRKHRDGSLRSIKNPDGFLFNLIKYQSLKENRYVERLFRFEGINGLLK